MRVSSRVVALLVFASGVPVAALGCGRRVYEADVAAVCDAEQRAPRQGATRLEQLDRAVLAIGPTLRSPEGKKLAERLMGSDVDPGQVLRLEAARAHVKPCALAEAYGAERARVRWEHDLRELCAWKVDDVEPKSMLTTQGARFCEELRLLPEGARRERLRLEAKAAGFAACAQAKAR